ncbi:Uncharacterized conserved protein YceK [Izhakiella capsodis]|uniref:Uncharacterized conserved protein YceK n=1 Tax=Izhakiella capsodis TaxID=1367852 RepID=A0A1I5A1F7_9GAMM|nr:YceK/YidQ family lipoprotein [Izhakiella capsodis]SFN56227.1 Uncharacterized conserved protein YceK [Izhakiella capsodis]
MIALKITRKAGIVICLSLVGSGCSSIMTHTGPDQGYYPGTRACGDMIADSNNSWPLRSLAAIDLPFSALMDTLLLPMDYFRSGKDKSQDSLRERVLRSEKRSGTNESLSQSAPLTVNEHQ